MEVIVLSTLLRFHDLAKSFGAKEVFAALKGEINAPAIIGLVGDNGCGKSTLLRILAGEEKADAGEIQSFGTLQIAYLPQELPPTIAGTAYAYVRAGLIHLTELEDALRKTAGQLQHNPASENLLSQYGKLQHGFEQSGGYEMDAATEKSLHAVGLPVELWKMPLDALSGGQKTRVNLARCLVVQPELLLLDEPTNYLDLQGLGWLESWLRQAGQTVVLVSHDRYFLDKVATEIWELDRGQLQCFTGNYSAYKAQKEQQLQEQYAAYAKEQAEKRRLRELIARQMQWFESAHKKAGQDDFLRAKAKKGAARAKSTVSRMQRVIDQGVEKPWEKDELGIAFQATGFSSQSLLAARQVSFSYGAEQLLKGVNFELRPGERVAILGANGAGKTTLLRLLLGELVPKAGQLYRSPSLSVGHFSQERDDLNPTNSLLAELVATGIGRSEAWLILARLGFRDQDVLTEIRTLSVGQRARVSLAKLLVLPHNVLVLDEPTNHLDIRSREKIEEALQDYPGALILVSHDRYFLDASVNQVYLLETGAITRYLGNYSYYEQSQMRDPAIIEQQEQETIMRTRLAELAARISALAIDTTEYQELDAEYHQVAAHLRSLLTP